MTSIKDTETVSLAIPIVVHGSDETERRTITSLALRRPKTRHVKKVVALLGPEFVNSILGDAGEDLGRDDIVRALAMLADEARLQALTELVADLASEKTAVIDEIDPVDLLAVLGAVVSFFPELPSIGSSSS